MWNDPDININWGLMDEPIISDKDKNNHLNRLVYYYILNKEPYTKKILNESLSIVNIFKNKKKLNFLAIN